MSSATQTPSADMSPPTRIALSLSNGVLEIRCVYDPALVPRLRSLPGARYTAEQRAWRVAASRSALTKLAVLLHELGETVRVSHETETRRRLDRCSPAWVTAHDEGVVVRGPYNPVRVRLMRTVPEAVYAPGTRRWVVAVTRASAAALLHAIDLGGWRFEVEERTRRLLERVREGAPDDPLRTARSAADPGVRRSPIPHWRHHVRGAIFDANRDRREWVEGIGWCVRVRVDPSAGR